MALDRWWIEAQAVTDEFAEDASRQRHAVNGNWPGYGARIETLCGDTAITTRPVPGMPAPECRACDRRWRTLDGIAQRSEHLDIDGAARFAHMT